MNSSEPPEPPVPSAASGVAPDLAWRRLSIGIKLPIGVALLLTLASATLSAAAYWHVRQLAFELASERLKTAATQLEAVIGPALRQRVAALQRVSLNPKVVEYVTESSEERQDEITSILERLPPGNGRSGIAVLDATGHPMLVTGALTVDELALNPPNTPRDGAIDTLRRSAKDEDLFYDLVIPIENGGRLGGRILERRWLTASAPGLNLLTGLIGPEARLIIGNRDGSVWTDFHQTRGTLPSAAPQTLIRYPSADGRAFVARGVNVRDSPLMLAASTPIGPVLSPADRFLLRALWVTTAIVIVGALAGWLFSRRVTSPLRQLTAAAERIASPDGHVREQRHGDEVVRLDSSFAQMVARVDDSHRQLQLLVDDLEVRVKARTAELEAANHELEAFSYSVSHDLRAPIRAISAFSNILIEDHGAELSQDARHCVDIVIKRAKHMGQLIDDLLMFSRLSRQPITRQTVSMTALCSAIIAELRSVDPARIVDISIGDMPDAYAEPALLRQVMTNLLQNALKYTRPQSAAHVEVGCYMQGGEQVYYVRDNGVGFDMQYADRLFGVFQRLHREEDFEGTGVGLAIVHRIVTRHVGRVWADAAVNAGATFFFTLAPAETGVMEAA